MENTNPHRKPRRSGVEVLDTELAMAEAKEAKSKANASCLKRRSEVKFVYGGTINASRPAELGTHSVMFTSKATNNGESEDMHTISEKLQPRPKRTIITLYYNRINRMQLEGRLTEPESNWPRCI